jgi:transcriptional regulator with XRE-family HTH domain
MVLEEAAFLSVLFSELPDWDELELLAAIGIISRGHSLSIVDAIDIGAQKITMPQYSEQLSHFMQTVGIPSFRELSDRSGLSRRAIDTIRRGQAESLKYADLNSLANLLQISLDRLIQEFSSVTKLEHLPQPDQPSHNLRAEFERETLHHLESMILQLPTAAYAASHNPDLPARHLLPLLLPLTQLLSKWGIEAIAQVGEEVEFNPQVHSLVEGGNIEPGTMVTVRYVGYRQAEKLLYRARVSPIA